MKKLSAVFTFLFLLMLIVQSLVAGENPKTDKLAQLNARYKAGLQQKLLDGAFAQRLQRKAEREISSEKVIQLFLGKMANLDQTLPEIHRSIQERLAMRTATGSGSISGKVTENGWSLYNDVLVIAFDEHGFPAGDDTTGYDKNGAYLIGGLPAGKYYLVTRSDDIFIDEIYNDIPLAAFTSWRQASTVEVADGATISNINFELKETVWVTGYVYEADGVTPVVETEVDFAITNATSPRTLFRRTFETYEDGYYGVRTPIAEDFRISASASGYLGEWFNNQDSWQAANNVQWTGEQFYNINFSLARGAGVGKGTSVISGYAPTWSFLVAFDLADTTIAGLGLSYLGYSIENLHPGAYIVLGLDFLKSYTNEYYKDAPTPATATPITLAESDTAKGIDIFGDTGGSIQGSVLGPTGAPLDSVLVFAFRKGILTSDPFLSNVELTLTTTKTTGEYTLSGLSTGEYVIRTFTPTLATPEDLQFFLPYLGLGMSYKHIGTVVDEYYENVYNLLAFDQATPVSVTAPQVVTGIDLHLEAPGAITGRVTDATGAIPVTDVTILPINVVSQLPEITTFTIDSLGYYKVWPLPTGDYKLLATALPGAQTPYLLEFYGGGKTFATALTVTVTAPNSTPNKDFTLELGGTIQGFVNLSPGVPAGADTLSGVPVVAYDALTGEVAAVDSIRFSGGYHISPLWPGSYKVAALPLFFDYAVTYAGGGATFTDAASSVITIAGDEVVEQDILLGKASGAISGFVHEAATSQPINVSLMLAYDPSGHAVSAGFSGYDPIGDTILENDGRYRIAGLRSGTYYLRSVSLFGAMSSLRGINPLDVFSLLAVIDPTLQPHQDEWYDGVPIPTGEYNLLGLVADAVMGGDLLEVPFASAPLAGAKPVVITGANETANINFELGAFELPILNVAIPEQIPASYTLQQNYPNPFNPETVIQYQLPKQTEVRLEIYNLLGELVKTLVDEKQSARYYAVTWDGRDEHNRPVASGVYLYRLTAGEFAQVRKMILVR